jgi:hypothetical protein
MADEAIPIGVSTVIESIRILFAALHLHLSGDQELSGVGT